MQFIIFRKADEETEAETSADMVASPQLIADMTSFHDEGAKAGIVIGGAGLHPTRNGARVKFRDGHPTVTDGPFTEAKELVAGYTLIEAPSLEAALDWVKQWPKLDGHGNVELEVRQLYTEADFGDAYTEAMSIKDAAREALATPK
jgi:hypothetical protein